MLSHTDSAKKSNTGKYRRVAAVLAAAIMLPATSAFANGFAGAGNPGGFTGPGPSLATVQQAQGMGDDTRVSLKGNIVNSLGDEAYTFKDATGTIEVDIDNEIWRGQTINPEDVVTISGEIDREWNHTSVDVSSVVKQ